MQGTSVRAMNVVALSSTAEPRATERQWGVRPIAVLRVALFLYVLSNVGRIPVLDLGDRAAPLLINDLCVGLVLLVGAIAAVQRRSLRLDNVSMAALVFAFIGATSAVLAIPRYGLSTFEVLASLAYLARWSVYFCVYLVIINWVRGDQAESVWTVLENAILLMAVFGIFQAIFLPNFAFMVTPQSQGVPPAWDAQRHRLVSTMLEPNVMAAVLTVPLMVQLARLSTGARVPMWKPVVLFAALVMTLSRGGILSFLIGCTVIVATRGVSKRVLKVAGAILLLALPIMPRLITFAREYNKFSVSDDSAMARVTTWVRALGAFAEHPWFGIGFNTYGFVQERRGFERVGGQSYSAEGGLLFIAVMTGIVGLAVFLMMLFFVFRRCRRGWRDLRATPAERGLYIGTAAATLAMLINSVFVNSLLTPWVMELLWVTWGLTFVTIASWRRRTSDAPA